MKRLICILLLLVLTVTPMLAQLEGEEDAPLGSLDLLVEEMLQTAETEIGYTATKGGKSKYGEWAGGAYKEWCTEFVSWVADQTQQRTGISLVNLFYPYQDTCEEGVKWYTEKGRYLTVKGNIKNMGDQWYWEDGVLVSERAYIPKAGDLMYIEWYKYNRIDHVALVEYVSYDETDGYLIHTIEGNNKILGPEPTTVDRYTYKLDDASIRAYGLLRDGVVGTTMRSGNSGENVATLQGQLIALGHMKGTASGNFGDSTTSALKAFQKAEGIKATGIADQETQTRLRALAPQIIAAQLQEQEKLASLGAGQPFFTEFDITDEASVWARLTQDITVLDADPTEKIYLRQSPDGPLLSRKEYTGYLYGRSAAVRVLEITDGWALIEGYNMRNELIRGYVKERLIKTTTPNQQYGIVVDKKTQTLYIFIDGKMVSTLIVSTGLPTKAKPYNETAQGEYLLISRTGGFWSGDMYCDMAIRFNGGDLLHLVPCLVNGDGSYNFAPFTPKLGSRASHGCIRTQRVANEDGYNMRWIWDNVPMGTKILVWDDAGRPIDYPSDDMDVFYNPEGGSMYHGSANCSGVKKRWLPLTAFKYAQFEEEPFASLTPCSKCSPPMRKSEVDAYNASNVAK